MWSPRHMHVQVLASKPDKLKSWLAQQQPHLDVDTLEAIHQQLALSDSMPPAAASATQAAPAAAAAAAQPTPSRVTASVQPPATSRVRPDAASVLTATGSVSPAGTPGPATPKAAEQPKPALKAAAAAIGARGPSSTPQAGPQATAESAREGAADPAGSASSPAASRWWDSQPAQSSAVHALPPGLPVRIPEVRHCCSNGPVFKICLQDLSSNGHAPIEQAFCEQLCTWLCTQAVHNQHTCPNLSSLCCLCLQAGSTYSGWALPIATACAGVMAYAAFHERRALAKCAHLLALCSPVVCVHLAVSQLKAHHKSV